MKFPTEFSLFFSSCVKNTLGLIYAPQMRQAEAETEVKVGGNSRRTFNLERSLEEKVRKSSVLDC